jgi:hypothetical protein
MTIGLNTARRGRYFAFLNSSGATTTPSPKF